MLDPAALVRHWVHSHEEDSPATLVYRPKGYAFPPARGRKALELDASGAYVELGYGSSDRRARAGDGRFRLEGSDLVLADATGKERRLRVLELAPSRLVLAKP
jgi:hypothetical protein